GLEMPEGELADLLPLMCVLVEVAEWKGDPRAQQSFSLLLAVLEDGSYHLMNALKKYESLYYLLVRGMSETFKACIVQKEANANDGSVAVGYFSICLYCSFCTRPHL